jgi:hypothetical protein
MHGPMNFKFKHKCFWRCFVFDGEHSRYPPCANISVAKFSDYDHNRRFFKTYSEHCSLVIQQSSRISASTLSSVSVVGVLAGRPLRGPVSNVLSTALKTKDSLSSPYMLFRRPWISMGLETFVVRNQSPLSTSTHVHNIRHFALLLCWTHLTK